KGMAVEGRPPAALDDAFPLRSETLPQQPPAPSETDEAPPRSQGRPDAQEPCTSSAQLLPVSRHECSLRERQRHPRPRPATSSRFPLLPKHAPRHPFSLRRPPALSLVNRAYPRESLKTPLLLATSLRDETASKIVKRYG